MRRFAAAFSTVVVLALGLAAAPAAEQAAGGAAGKGLILLVRHAERPPASSPSDDPPLTDAGKARAERLATVLADAGIDAIFVTRFRRTRETAAPIAERLKLTPVVESATDGLVAALRARAGETVLIVGHSDTIPAVVAAFGGPPVAIGDDDYGDVFVLAPGTGALTRLRY